MPGLRPLLGVIMFEFPDELNLPIIYDDGGLSSGEDHMILTGLVYSQITIIIIIIIIHLYSAVRS